LRRRPTGHAIVGLTLAFAVLVAAPAVARVVAIGDVHGDLIDFRKDLQAAGVLGDDGQWIGGDAVVVQLGDLVDRGPQARGALDFAMALEKGAAAGGGRFVALLGNHEVMNMAGDLRYVTAENYAEFAGPESERRQRDGWRAYEEWRRGWSRRHGRAAPPVDWSSREAWAGDHPAGYLEHCEAFSPEGTYGRWLRARPALAVERGSVFVHGGIAPSKIGLSLDEIDRQVHQEIDELDQVRRGLVAAGVFAECFDLPQATLVARAELAALDAVEPAPADPESTRVRALLERFLAWDTLSIFSADGPLWFRGYSKWSDEEGAVEMPKLLSAYGVERFVVGHTPQTDGTIRSRFDGAALMVDTGMYSSYFKGGRASALEIDGGGVSAIYPGGERRVLEPATGDGGAVSDDDAAPSAKPGAAPAADPFRRRFLGPDGEPLPFASDDELLAFIRDARVVDVHRIGEGITNPRRLTLERDGVRARVVFRDVFKTTRITNVGGGRRETNLRDFYGFEPAVYRLARLLGFDRVPPAELYELEGEKGSVQIWIEQARTEGMRREANLTPPDPLRWKRQLQTMLVWHSLVGDIDPNQGNLLYGPDWEFWLIDHTRSFRRSTDLPNGDKIIWCQRALFENLRGVSDDDIRVAVGDAINKWELDALLARRRNLVELIERRIRERGEESVLFDGSL